MRVGAHVSAAGSLDLAVDRAVEIGCECIQIFVGNPRQWQTVKHPKAEIREFRKKREAAGIDPLVAHSCYLINLASPRKESRQRSIRSLIAAMRTVMELGGLGVVTHIGSRLGTPLEEAIDRVADSIHKVLEKTEGVTLLLENSSGTTLGGSWSELANILAAADHHPRIGFCLDTAHLFGAGVDLRTEKGMTGALNDFDKAVGMDRLGFFHLNDSKAELGSLRDRHENIGAGTIGRKAFQTLLRDPRVRNLAGTLEVPGFEGGGPDKKNIDILKRLRKLPAKKGPASRGKRVRRKSQ